MELYDDIGVLKGVCEIRYVCCDDEIDVIKYIKTVNCSFRLLVFELLTVS